MLCAYKGLDRRAQGHAGHHRTARGVSVRPDANKDQEICRVLYKLSKLAEKYNCAIIVMRHLNKSGGGKAIYRGNMSIGVIDHARVGWLCVMPLITPTGVSSQSPGLRTRAPWVEGRKRRLFYPEGVTSRGLESH
jgi:hypothetical protein